MPTMTDLAGLVLAGGASRRMGRNKAQLSVRGKTLVETMTEVLQAAGCAPVLLSGNGGIPDAYPGKGPLAGMQAAFGHAGEANFLLVVPVDMPDLSADSLKQLAATPGEVVFYKNQSLPLKLTLSDRVKARLEQILQTPDADLSIRNFVSELDVRTLAISEINTRELTNINTQADLKTWEESHETQT